jgi:arylsulfatase A-like enzyme
VILADHGDGLGEHGHIGHTRYLYQEDISIPLLIYDEESWRYRNDSFATQIDVAPTIVERLGLPLPSGWQGQSLMQPVKDRMTLHQTRRGRSPCFAVVDRTGATFMKFIRCGSGANVSEELFDLVSDPQEQNNLVPRANASQLGRYRRELDSRFTKVFNRCKRVECRD